MFWKYFRYHNSHASHRMFQFDNSEQRRHSQTTIRCIISSVNTSRPNKSAPFKKCAMKKKTREGPVVSFHPLSQNTIERDTEMRCPRRKIRKILLLGIRRVSMPGFCCSGVKGKNKRRSTSYSRKKKVCSSVSKPYTIQTLDLISHTHTTA
jgi:hypothetical protein